MQIPVLQARKAWGDELEQVQAGTKSLGFGISPGDWKGLSKERMVAANICFLT